MQTWWKRTAVPSPLLVVVAIASVQIGSAVGRTAFDVTGAPGMTVLRLGLSGLLLTTIVRPRARGWTRRQWAAAALLGVILGSMNLVFYLAIQHVPLGVAVTVEFLGPLLLALVQTRGVTEVLWVALAGAGVALLGLGTSGSAPLRGLALAALAGVFWAGYILASAWVGRLLPGVDGLAVALLVGTVLTLPFGAAGAVKAFGDAQALAAGCIVAVMSSLIPYGLELVALRSIPTRVFGVLMSLEPAAAALAGRAILGQVLGLREVVALTLVSVASLGVTLTRRGDRPAVQPLE